MTKLLCYTGVEGAETMKNRKRAFCGVLLLALAAGLVADSKYHLQLTKYDLSFRTLPAAFDGFRIVQLSDLHGAMFGQENSQLIRLVREQDPDLIALTGDLISSAGDLDAVKALLRGLKGVAPICFVNGNHEWASGARRELDELLARYGVIRLENRYLPLERRGERIVLAGAEDPNGWADMPKPDEVAAALRQEYPEEFVLWLGHRNDWTEKYPELPVDLILSGHAHGGVVRLPLLGGLFGTEHRLFADHESGVYESGSYRMTVSRGLGNSVAVPRLFNRPEVVLIILHSER